MRWLALLLLTCCSLPAGRTLQMRDGRVEVGAIGGAPFRIDVPAHWNGELLVYSAEQQSKILRIGF